MEKTRRPNLKGFFQSLIKGRPNLDGDRELTDKVAGSLAAYISSNPEQGRAVLADLLLEVTRLRIANEEHEANSETDALTGALNRRGFNKLMEMFDESAQHPERRTTGRHFMAVIDLDGFKQINDTLGHEAGDEALKYTVSALQKMIRKSDTVCRTGGDEFVIILKNATPEGAEKKIKQIEKAFRTMDFDFKEVKIPVRCTIAYGEIDPNPTRLTKNILEEIDLKMIETKKAKGNTRYAPIPSTAAQDNLPPARVMGLDA